MPIGLEECPQCVLDLCRTEVEEEGGREQRGRREGAGRGGARRERVGREEGGRRRKRGGLGMEGRLEIQPPISQSKHK